MQKLLVVDENTTIQRVIKLAFKDEDIRVTTVPRGRDVFEQIEDDPPDIILADIGREVAAFLKNRPKISHIPVVLLKGAFDAPGDGPDEALGCDDVLMKPLQPQAMIDRVKRLLRDRERAGSPSPRVTAPAPSGPQPTRNNGDNPQPPDQALELSQYFDRLSVAFGQAGNNAASPVADAGWLYPGAPTRDTTASPPPRLHAKPVAPASVVSEELIEQITQRVLDRLGDRVVRSTATELVARLSKWLIVDEVERARKEPKSS